MDDDGTAYLLYSSDAHAQIEVLTDDYLASTWATDGRTSGVFPEGNEAPAMFKRNGLYYALISDSCCYCGGGGTVRAFMASSPLGPYRYTGSITDGPNPFNREPRPRGAPPRQTRTLTARPLLPALALPRAAASHVSTSSQQTFAFALDDQIIWVGDRWQSAPEPARLKSQDFTTFFLLNFTANGTVLPIAWADDTIVEVPDLSAAGA